jgi:hypothetical protein
MAVLIAPWTAGAVALVALAAARSGLAPIAAIYSVPIAYVATLVLGLPILRIQWQHSSSCLLTVATGFGFGVGLALIVFLFAFLDEAATSDWPAGHPLSFSTPAGLVLLCGACGAAVAATYWFIAFSQDARRASPGQDRGVALAPRRGGT